jgi:hypothetical protein
MNKNKEQERIESKNPDKINKAYLIMNIGLLLILPLVSLITESIFEKTPVSPGLFVKWFIFWAAGIRLFTAGITQTSNPAFTATKIFRLKPETYVIIRELGLANIALGVMGILSLLNDSWRMLAAISCSIFFGLAALQHSLRETFGYNELIAALYDAIVCIVLLLYLLFNLIL